MSHKRYKYKLQNDRLLQRTCYKIYFPIKEIFYYNFFFLQILNWSSAVSTEAKEKNGLFFPLFKGYYST